MVIELAVGRMLTPVFGGSIEVWGVVIAVTMGALAAGYAVGGWLADHRGAALAHRAALAGALFMTVTPLVRGPILRTFADASTTWGTLGSASLLLLPPLVALGMVSPALVRTLAQDGSVGRETGRVYAVSTLGSMAGALLAGIWLLPVLDVNTVVLGAALLLSISAAWGAPRLGAGLVLLVLYTGWQAWPGRELPAVEMPDGSLLTVVAREPSPFGEVRVIERGHRRQMLSNGVDQGGVDLRSGRSAYAYAVNLVGLVPLYRSQSDPQVLLIGLGPGVIATDLEARGWDVTSVEIDPAVVRVAQTWFGFEGQVHIEDGRRFLRRSDQRWDVIIVDAYLSGSPPSHLFTKEAFESYRAHLTEDGLVLLNVIGNDQDPAQAPALRAVLATAATLFDTVEAWPDPGQSEQGPTRNHYVVATDLSRRPSVSDVRVPLAFRKGQPILAQDGRLLTDNGRSLDTLILATARHVRRQTSADLPLSIRVD
jgi:spermidine synthase